MGSLVGSFLTSFLISFASIPSIIKVSRDKNLYDVPEERKRHLTATPTLGGIALFTGLLVSFLFWVGPRPFPELRCILCGVIILFFVGIKDDILHTVAYKKLIAQIAAAVIVVYWGDVRLTSFYGLMGIYSISIPVSYVVSLLGIVGITNAFNFIDGVDCLAGFMGVIASGFFGLWFFLHNFYSWSMLAFCLMGAVLGFLCYNRSPARIFMGDTGSLILGLVCSVMAIKFIEINQVHSFVESSPVVAMGVLAIPLYDTLRVMLIRMSRGLSPLSADRNHLHHLLTDLGLSHMKTSLVLAAVNIGVLLFAYRFQRIGSGVGLGLWSSEILLGLVILFLVSFSFSLGRLRRFRMGKQRFPVMAAPVSTVR
jgi:UDP-N-acetylmuramyl pentapeptide phosphotransferase/UDP-N-acetylglucosamine-1-phosphate transferase